MRALKYVFTLVLFLFLTNCLKSQTKGNIRGWNILSDSYEDALKKEDYKQITETGWKEYGNVVFK